MKTKEKIITDSKDIDCRVLRIVLRNKQFDLSFQNCFSQTEVVGWHAQSNFSFVVDQDAITFVC